MNLAQAYVVFDLPYGSPLFVVKKAFRRLAKELHPDMGGDEKLFRIVNEAHAMIAKHWKSGAPLPRGLSSAIRERRYSPYANHFYVPSRRTGFVHLDHVQETSELPPEGMTGRSEEVIDFS